MKEILFVCLGNICRSPAAEAVMNTLIAKQKLTDAIHCDSAGTYGGHAGEPADSRMIRHASKRDITITGRSRQIHPADLETYDLIVGMDSSNISNIKALDRFGAYHHKIVKMTDFCTVFTASEVPDPYYGGSEGFEKVLDILEDGCANLLEFLLDDE